MTNSLTSDDSARTANWRAQAADIAFASAVLEPASAASCIGDMARLLADHPDAKVAGRIPPVGVWLAHGANAAAALALVEPLAGYMLSRSPGGRHMATVVLAGQADEHHAEGHCAALALVGALAAALAAGSAPPQTSRYRRPSAPILRVN